MQLPELTNYINGATSVPAIDRNNSLRNANTAEPIQAQLCCDAEQVEEALQAADKAYQVGEWEHTPAAERADILDQIGGPKACLHHHHEGAHRAHAELLRRGQGPLR